MNPSTRERLLRRETFDCECCGQRVAAYQYGINPYMLHQLRLLDAAHPNALHARDMQVTTSGLWRKYSFLRFWGFVDDLGDAQWRITQRGRDFLQGRFPVSRYVYLFNNECVGTSRERTFVGGLAEWPGGDARDTDETHATYLQPVATEDA